MKFLFISLFFSLTFNSFSQLNSEVYLDHYKGIAFDKNTAMAKAVSTNQSKKKFDLKWYDKRSDKWIKTPYSNKITRKKKNFFKIQHCINEKVVRTSELEIIETTNTGFVIKEYEDGFCVRKSDVSSVFPIIYNGFSAVYEKRKQSAAYIDLYTNNLRYEVVKEGINQNFQSLRPAMYPEGKKKFILDILDNITIPDKLETNSLNDTLIISFTVDTMGQIINPKVINPFNEIISKQIPKVMTTKISPWIPAYQGEKSVPTSYLIPLVIKAEPKVYKIAQKMPLYPGGDIQLRKDIAMSVQYPIEAQMGGIQGKVFVSFIVDTMGKINNARVARGVSLTLDREALRVINNLQNTWIPGEQKGEKVCVSYTVPINFVLQEKTVVRTKTTIHKNRKSSIGTIGR